jgi:hypothetical protein
MACTTCELDSGLERVRYFSRQLIGADDMTAEQRYFRQKLRRHNRFVHGWGVVCGCEVKPAANKEHPWRVRVCPGYVLGPQGDEIAIGDGIHFDLATGASEGTDPCVRSWPCPPTGNMPSNRRDAKPVHLAVRYAECDARPQRLHAVGCSCDEQSCEYSRTRDDFELHLLWEIPESHVKTALLARDYCKALKDAKAKQEPPPTPPCPECPDEPWVILATIKLPASANEPVAQSNITYRQRHLANSTWAMHVEMRCGG